MDPFSGSALAEFIRYNNWANQQVLEVCQNLSEDQLAASTPGAYGSIQATLGHMIAAEADYVGRLTGQPLQPPFRWEDRPGIAALSAFAPQVAAALLDAAQRIEPGYIVHEDEEGNFLDYQALALFIQVINHGVEHRTNITTTISGLGLPVPEVDGWGYLFAHPDRFAMKKNW